MSKTTTATKIESTTNYELWFLGDHFKSGTKNESTFQRFLKEAHELLKTCIDEGIQIGGVEICEVREDGRVIDSLWSMNVCEIKKS